MSTSFPKTLPKNQFKCFRCKVGTLRAEGEWVNWNEMQVHLCPACERLTRQSSERTARELDANRRSGRG